MHAASGPNSMFSWRAGALVATLALLLSAVTILDTPARAQTSAQFLLADRDRIMALPTSGSAWNALLSAANRSLVPDLSNQNNLSSTDAVAAGLVYVRTGNNSYRTKVIAALRALPGTENRSGTRTLSIGRQLGGWVIAADLVGYRDSSFVQWVSTLRTRTIGGHGRWTALHQTHEDTANNWGTFAGASRVAASLYVGDRADVERAARVFRGWVGEDPGAWPTLPRGQSGSGFRPTADLDLSWSCRGSDWIPLNGRCASATSSLDGALIEDISRSANSWPSPPDQTGFMYSWEVMQGVTLQALLLGRNGYPDVWDWSERGLYRAMEYLRRSGGFNGSNFHRVNHWVPWVIDAMYDTNYAGSRAADRGRNLGFTDWLAPALEPAPRRDPDPDPGEPGSGVPLVGAVASGWQWPNVAANAIDGNLSTRWSAEGRASLRNGRPWLRVDLAQPALVSGVEIAWYVGDNGDRASFHLEVSQDGSQWTRVLSAQSSGATLAHQGFAFSPVRARYLRYVGEGRERSAWNSVTNLRVNGR